MKKKVLGKKHSKNDVHSIAEDSFFNKRPASVSPGSHTGTGHVDTLIDYLSNHLTELDTRNECLAEFERLTCDVIMKCADPDLHRIFKEQGWIGTHYQLSYEPPHIDAQSCLNALSNYYLKINAQPAISDINADGNIESHNLDQILPFCPDILVNYLKKQPITAASKDPRRLTFKGACMLADISGFSKFSGAMCSKGVSGLDDLREATNGFLGYFVKQVYEYEGDVIAFAGDALICAFRNSAEGIAESCFRALQCAHVLRQHKTAYLSTHIGVTCGEMQIALLGGHNDQWCYVMNGDCVSQLASCIEDAGSQEVAITAEVYEYAKIRDNARSLPVAYKHQLVVDPKRKPTGNYLLKNIAVKRNTTTMPPSPFATNNTFDFPVEEAGDSSGGGNGGSTGAGNAGGFGGGLWGALKGHSVHHSHVHEVATDVLLKTRSDYLIKDESKRTGLASLGISSMTSSLFFANRTVSQQQLVDSSVVDSVIVTDTNTSTSNTTSVISNGKVNLTIDTGKSNSVSGNSGSNSSAVTPAAAVHTTPVSGTPTTATTPTTTTPSGRLVRKGSMTMETYSNSALKGKKNATPKGFARAAPQNRPLPITPTFKTKPSALDMLQVTDSKPFTPRSISKSATYTSNSGHELHTYDMNIVDTEGESTRGRIRMSLENGSKASVAAMVASINDNIANNASNSSANGSTTPNRLSTPAKSNRNSTSSVSSVGGVGGVSGVRSAPNSHVKPVTTPVAIAAVSSIAPFNNTTTASSTTPHNTTTINDTTTNNNTTNTTNIATINNATNTNSNSVTANSSTKTRSGSRDYSPVNISMYRESSIGKLNLSNSNSPNPAGAGGITFADTTTDNVNTTTGVAESTDVNITTTTTTTANSTNNVTNNTTNAVLCLNSNSTNNSNSSNEYSSHVDDVVLKTPPLGRGIKRGSGVGVNMDAHNINNTTTIPNNTTNTAINNTTTNATTPHTTTDTNSTDTLAPLTPTLPLTKHSLINNPHNLSPNTATLLHTPLSHVNHSNNTSYSSMTSENDLRMLLTPTPSQQYNTNATNTIPNTTTDNTTRTLPTQPYSRTNSIDAKRRFAGWGIMKTALRRESFRDKHGTSEVAYIQSISKFVPRPVLNAVHTECLDLIGELRQVTTLFCGLNSYSDQLNKDPCTLQPWFLMAQTVLHECGGFLRQFLVDDKGCVFIAMWGVPSFTYSNNCSRALYCAAKIRAGSVLLQHDVSIGIATGTVFCGSVGALERRDYAGVGTDVNMAARLMGKAKSRILIDVNTHKILNQDAQKLLIPAEEMVLKGMGGPCVPYQYTATTLPSIADIDVESAQNSVLRPAMQAALIRLLDTFMNVGTADTNQILDKKLRVCFAFLFGMPGTGKNLAVQYYRSTARLRGVNCIHLIARSDSQGIPYGLLRELFLELVGKSNFITQHQQYSKMCSLIEEICDDTDSEEDRTNALLSLQLVLGVDIDMQHIYDVEHTDLFDNDTSDPTTYIRMETKHSMSRINSTSSRKHDDYTFYNVVAYLLRNTPTVVIIENAHYVDELSWKELYLMQAGDQLDMHILLTMEVSRIPEGAYKSELIGNSTPSNKAHASSMHSFKGDYWESKEGAEAEIVDSPNKYSTEENEDDFPVDYPTLATPRGMLNKSNSSTVGGVSIGGSGGNGGSNGGSVHLSKQNSNSNVLTTQKSTQSLISQRSNLNLDNELTPTLSIRSHPTEFWCSILDNTTTTVMVMGELTRDEIKHEMSRSLPTAVLTDGLVDLVNNITSGNAYWCKAMTQFIKEHGAQALFSAVTDRRSRQNPLKQLVLVHFEAHTPDLQVISKHASIIGVEFDEQMLYAIVPPKLKNTLTASLDKLVEKRFIQCLDPQDRTFCFPNQLIQATIYELTPPSDAAHLHLQVAQFVESAFGFELRSHYPTLGYHYRRCPDKRPLAFKYELKAADQQVAKGAFSDGLTFLKSAAKLAEREVELDVVLEVIDRAIADIKEQTGQTSLGVGSGALMRIQSFYSGSTDSRVNGIVLRYNALKKLVLTKIEQLKAAADKLIAEEKSADRKKELLIKSREESTGARLNWQPSYVAKKRGASGQLTSATSRGSIESKEDGDYSEASVKAGCKCAIM